jgi:hypothetical protein
MSHDTWYDSMSKDDKAKRFPPDFWMQMARKMAQIRDNRPVKKPWKVDRYRYHQHVESGPRCSSESAG